LPPFGFRHSDPPKNSAFPDSVASAEIPGQRRLTAKFNHLQKPATSWLALHLSEDAWQGDAQFTLAVEGKPISTPQNATTLHSSGQWEEKTSTSPGTSVQAHTRLAFTNDAYGGTPSTDRNLYVNGIDLNGQHHGSGVITLLSSGAAAAFTVVTFH
jgi:predicted component of type VI protein secretion system